MWLSTVTFDLAGIKALAPDVAASLRDSLATKKQELKTVDGAGSSLPEFPAPDSTEDISPTANTLVIKRAWNTESAAREFASFADSASEHITTTVEEQA